MDLSLDPYYGQSSQLLFGHPEHTQQTAPQTPQTPSSIPDIVLQGIWSVYLNRARMEISAHLFSHSSYLLRYLLKDFKIFL